jgi:hypothetical protein
MDIFSFLRRPPEEKSEYCPWLSAIPTWPKQGIKQDSGVNAETWIEKGKIPFFLSSRWRRAPSESGSNVSSRAFVELSETSFPLVPSESDVVVRTATGAEVVLSSAGSKDVIQRLNI